MLQFIAKLPRLLTLGLAFPLIFLNGWLLLIFVQELQPLFSILITATLLAFLLDYPIRFLVGRRMKRGIAVTLVLLLFLLLLGVLGVFLVPLILRQANELLTRLPEWIKSGQQQLKTLESWGDRAAAPDRPQHCFQSDCGALDDGAAIVDQSGVWAGVWGDRQRSKCILDFGLHDLFGAARRKPLERYFGLVACPLE